MRSGIKRREKVAKRGKRERERTGRRTIASGKEGEEVREGRFGGRGVREGNIALTQTMRSLERSFQGLRKAYNPVYRPRKSGDIYSSAFVARPRDRPPPPRATTRLSCV